MRPELQTKDVAFPCQQVVIDVHPLHRQQVAADDAFRDEGGERGGRVAAVLDVVKRCGADREPLTVLFVPLGHARIEIPAVVIESRRLREMTNLVQTLLFELAEPDRDVGDLHAGIVDVILDLDLAAEEAEQAAERVSERRIAQVTDVRRFIGIDGRVLDDRLLRARRRSRVALAQPLSQVARPIEEEVDIPIRRRFDAGEPFDGPQAADNFLGDGARSLSQPARELEREGDRYVTHRPARRRLNRNRSEHRVAGVNAIEFADGCRHHTAHTLMSGENHAVSYSVLGSCVGSGFNSIRSLALA